MSTSPEVTAGPHHNPARVHPLSLRSLMSVVVIVSIVFAWHANGVHATRRAIAAVRAAGGHVYFDNDDPKRPNARRLPWIPAWVIDRVGLEHFFHVVNVEVRYSDKWEDEVSRQLFAFPRLQSFTCVEPGLEKRMVTDATIEVLTSLPELKLISLYSGGITDEGVRRLKACRNLESLTIAGEISGRGIAELGTLPKLRELYLVACPLGDECVNSLGDLTGLEVLDFSHERENCKHRCRLNSSWPRLRKLTVQFTELTHADWASLGRSVELTTLDLLGSNTSDPDLVAFRTLPKLRRLGLIGTKVTPQAVAELQESLPGVIIRGPSSPKVVPKAELLLPPVPPEEE